jgi:hypothetical protein
MKHFAKFNHSPLMDEAANALVEAGIELTKKYVATLEKGATMADKEEYTKDNIEFSNLYMKHCVEKAGYKFTGTDLLKNPQVYSDTEFNKHFRAVLAQIITPVAPAVITQKYCMVAEVRQIGWGETARFVIKSNDLFVVNDIAEGVRTGGLQRVYNDEFTVNPTPKQIRYDIPWYQVAAQIFDWGDFAYKIGLSFSSYINLLVIRAFADVVADWGIASSPYVTNGFSDSNYITIAQRVQAANGGSDVIVLGSLATVGTIFSNELGLQYGLGEEINKNGFLDKYKGYRIAYLDPSMIGTTVNTTATLVVPEQVLYFIPVGLEKPIKIVFEGENVTIEAIPTQTADKTGGLQITMRLGVNAVVGQRFGAITGVTGS